MARLEQWVPELLERLAWELVRYLALVKSDYALTPSEVRDLHNSIVLCYLDKKGCKIFFVIWWSQLAILQPYKPLWLFFCGTQNKIFWKLNGTQTTQEYHTIFFCRESHRINKIIQLWNNMMMSKWLTKPISEPLPCLLAQVVTGLLFVAIKGQAGQECVNTSTCATTLKAPMCCVPT